jgi:glycosyltransferase involved in cell wall biosynthesis
MKCDINNGLLTQTRKLLEKNDTIQSVMLLVKGFCYIVVNTTMNFSVVVICKNDASGLEETLRSVKDLGCEIIVYDSGSIDGSQEIALKHNARLIQGEWEGYGRNRFKAAQLATYDWILMLDTDEVVDDRLRKALQNLDCSKEKRVYNIRYKNFLGNKWIRYGEWGNDSHIRLGNRRGVETDSEIVHEKLFLQPGLEIKQIDGFILHYTVKNMSDYVLKTKNYALLSADKYYRQGKHATAAHIFLSPLYTFIKNYIFKLGFLDGREGFICAKMTAWYTFLKYSNLKKYRKAAIRTSI